MKDIVLFGMQGSGKGTQGAFLLDKFKMAKFETGAECRRMAAEDSDLGRQVKVLIESGSLVPDDVIQRITEHFFEAHKDQPFLFDGFPRNLSQLALLETLFDKYERDFIAINIEITEEEALKRLTTRKMCRACKKIFPASYEASQCDACQGELMQRSDDQDADAIKRRLEVFHENTLPCIQKLDNDGKSVTVSGLQSIEAVKEELLNKLDTINE